MRSCLFLFSLEKVSWTWSGVFQRKFTKAPIWTMTLCSRMAFGTMQVCLGLCPLGLVTTHTTRSSLQCLVAPHRWNDIIQCDPKLIESDPEKKKNIIEVVHLNEGCAPQKLEQQSKGNAFNPLMLAWAKHYCNFWSEVTFGVCGATKNKFIKYLLHFFLTRNFM